MLEKWWIIEGVGFAIIEIQNDRLITSSKFYFQAFKRDCPDPQPTLFERMIKKPYNEFIAAK